MFTSSFFAQGTDVKYFFQGCGSFGEFRGEVNRNNGVISHETENYILQCRYETNAYGVCTRNDSLTNRSNQPFTVRDIKSRFIFEGGEYQVYTQFCNWQSESRGAWQKLSTAVSVNGASTRTTLNAAPFLALWNEQEQRGVAIHLLPNAAWEMKVTRVGHSGKYSKVMVTAGISSYNFDLTLSPGQVLSLPQMICYEFKNKVDMDCHKLHHYLHERYPRREMPILYNTWMYCFDHLRFDNVSTQIDLAADLGVEYFIIDAGWFGNGSGWMNSVGDWEENTEGAFEGRMIDIAEKVRSAGMKFGLWIEPERAMPNCNAVRQHPDFYIPGDVDSDYCFLDFANPTAREWMLHVIFGLIERYGVAYIKDDFNANLYFDNSNAAFLRYHEGHKKFIQAIREKYPNLYLSSCAGGGMRMELNNYTEFDSNWPSDNESPYDEMKIYKETILRLPPQGFERWVAVHSLGGFEPFYRSFSEYNGDNTERMVACGDAIWRHIVGIQPSYLEGYMTGGPIGFSCDLTLLSASVRNRFKEFIAKIKQDRAFWMTAVARILCDTETVTAFQYSDVELSKVVVQLFTDHSEQESFRVYPVVNEEKTYRVNDSIISGRKIAEEGIVLALPMGQDNWYSMLELTLETV